MRGIQTFVMVAGFAAACGGEETQGQRDTTQVAPDDGTATATETAVTTDADTATTEPDVADEVTEDVEVAVELPMLNPDEDFDGDGVKNGIDGCARGETGWTTDPVGDFDGDGCRDSTEDTDDDQDGVSDASDACPSFDDKWPFVTDRWQHLSPPTSCQHRCTSQRRIEFEDVRHAEQLDIPTAFGPRPIGMGYRVTIPFRTDAALVAYVASEYWEVPGRGYSIARNYGGPMEPPRMWLQVRVDSFAPKVYRVTMVYEDGVCEWVEQKLETQPLPINHRNLRFEVRETRPFQLLGEPVVAHGYASMESPEGSPPQPWQDDQWACPNVGTSRCRVSTYTDTAQNFDDLGPTWYVEGNPLFVLEGPGDRAYVLVEWPFGTSFEQQIAHLTYIGHGGGPVIVSLQIDGDTIFERELDLKGHQAFYFGELLATTNTLVPARRCSLSWTRCESDDDCPTGRTCDEFTVQYSE